MDSLTVLFETPNTTVYFHDATSDFVVLSFSPLGLYGESRLSRIWGQQLFQKNDIAVVGVTAHWPHWFPQSDFELYGSFLSRFIENLGKPCLAYGHSMGAYAALKYGAALGVDAALAFSPQISIDPSDVGGFEKRFVGFFDADLHSEMAVTRVDVCPSNFIVFDPACVEDREHWIGICDFPETFPVLAPGTQHMTVDLVTHSEAAVEMFRIALSSCPDRSAGLRRLLRGQRSRTPNYWLNMFVGLCSRNKQTWADAVWGRLEAQGFTSLRLRIETARQAFRNKNFPRALEILDKLDLNGEASLSDLMEIRRMYEESGRIPSALRTAAEIAKRFPEHNDSWLIAAFYCLRMGHTPFAQAAMLRALEGESQDPAFWLRLSDAFLIVKLPRQAGLAAEKAHGINPSHLQASERIADLVSHQDPLTPL